MNNRMRTLRTFYCHELYPYVSIFGMIYQLKKFPLFVSSSNPEFHSVLMIDHAALLMERIHDCPDD